MSKMSELSIHLSEELQEVENIISELTGELETTYDKLWDIDAQLTEAKAVRRKLKAVEAAFTTTK